MENNSHVEIQIKNFGFNENHDFEFNYLFNSLINLTNIYFYSKTFGIIPPYFLYASDTLAVVSQIICSSLHNASFGAVTKKSLYILDKNSPKNVLKDKINI